ncbi:hypothetical protein PCASD_00279 [Puccinia coronata f. sp. avenae]|uniref:Uncharacterized protein n=1 Tax=Puccinia coronata f. sp. avenae TaxID=200324 RepID=A0A2N5VNB6_9BASI|nr:hypothetical protein PCASD_00279 [Puccinia coronata f. sp. avenae]
MSDRSLVAQAALGLLGILLLLEGTQDNPTPYYSDGGQAKYARFLLEEARSKLFREVTALEQRTFNYLVAELIMKDLLEDGRSVTVEEQLLMFLDIVVHSNSMRQTATKYFHAVLSALVTLYPKYVTLAPPEDKPERLKDPKYKAFKKCDGALDGVLIPATLPMEKQKTYRSRKGFVAQNTLAVFNFDFQFVYLLAGWEGSAHDSRVLADSFNKGFSIRKHHYYLADAGYAIQKGLLTPYQAVRYHLKEQAAAGRRPEDAKELYNLRHASLRNIVERLFGCLKAKFKILTSPVEHNIHRQVQLVYALATLWNFLRQHNQLDDDDELMREQTSEENNDTDDNTITDNYKGRRTAQEDQAASWKRDRMAKRLWNQYQGYLQNQH